MTGLYKGFNIASSETMEYKISIIKTFMKSGSSDIRAWYR